MRCCFSIPSAPERAHVVQAVGELDQDDPDVVRHRQEHLPDVLGLLLLVAVGAELRELGDAVDEVRDLGPEAVLDVGEAVLGVLGDVVEQRRRRGDRVDAEVGEDLGRGDRVGDVRLARGADLARVGLDGEVEGALDAAEVGLGMVAVELGEQRGPQAVQVDGRGPGAPASRRSASGRGRGPCSRRAVSRGAPPDRGRRAQPCAESTPGPRGGPVRPRSRTLSPGGSRRGRR